MSAEQRYFARGEVRNKHKTFHTSPVKAETEYKKKKIENSNFSNIKTATPGHRIVL